jgi:hypothetical protein
MIRGEKMIAMGGYGSGLRTKAASLFNKRAVRAFHQMHSQLPTVVQKSRRDSEVLPWCQQQQQWRSDYWQRCPGRENWRPRPHMSLIKTALAGNKTSFATPAVTTFAVRLAAGQGRPLVSPIHLSLLFASSSFR